MGWARPLPQAGPLLSAVELDGMGRPLPQAVLTLPATTCDEHEVDAQVGARMYDGNASQYFVFIDHKPFSIDHRLLGS
jgi:hypothetical protein